MLFLAGSHVFPALAHERGTSFLHLTSGPRELLGRWEIEVHDLSAAIGLDSKSDGAPSGEELRLSQPAARAYALGRLHLEADAKPLGFDPDRILSTFETSPEATNLVLTFTVNLAEVPERLVVRYQLLFDVLPEHRGLIQIDCDDVTQTAIFSPDHTTQSFTLKQPDRLNQFLNFAREGVWHIWIGFDHVLFLLALLLPSVLRRDGKVWKPVERSGEACLNLVKVVTAFTVAHSVTLSLAALELVTLPSRLVEPVIALSVMLAAANNVKPVVQGKAWAVAFGFGLIHGFGFAGVLADLGLQETALVVSLLGFNLGVELGQIAVVAGFFLLAYPFRASRVYHLGLVQGGSLVILAIAAFWLMQRVFGG